MSDQFLFFCTNIGSEKLLKEEVKNFYPDLSLSYSRSGFVTFKNNGVRYTLETISQLEVTFSSRSGICLGKSIPELLCDNVKKSLKELDLTESDIEIHSFSVGSEYILDAEEVFGREVNSYTPINKTVLDVIALSDSELWYGIHRVGVNTTHYPNSVVELNEESNKLSRSYLKIEEISKLYRLNIRESDLWLDFGSCPGGMSQYLLEKGAKVWGVDSTKTTLDHPRYSHIISPVQDLAQEDLPDVNINWVNVDLNLNPKQSIKEVLRLCKKYNFSLQGMMFSIPVIHIDQIKHLEDFEDHFFEWGFSKVICKQVSTHKQEFVLIAKR